MHNTFGDRSFAAVGPRVWNSLPAHLCDDDFSYNSFRRELNVNRTGLKPGFRGALIEQGSTSAPTQYRLYGRQFLQV